MRITELKRIERGNNTENNNNGTWLSLEDEQAIKFLELIGEDFLPRGMRIIWKKRKPKKGEIEAFMKRRLASTRGFEREVTREFSVTKGIIQFVWCGIFRKRTASLEACVADLGPLIKESRTVRCRDTLLDFVGAWELIWGFVYTWTRDLTLQLSGGWCHCRAVKSAWQGFS